MTPEDLVEIAAIERLKYRYARLLDQKDWAALAECFTEDATAAYGGADVITGRDAILAFLRQALGSADRISTHSVGQPEMELTGPDTASGTWALHDEVIAVREGFVVRGASVYQDEYVKRDGEWRIGHTGYRRIYEEIVRRPADARLTASWWDTGGVSELTRGLGGPTG